MQQNVETPIERVKKIKKIAKMQKAGYTGSQICGFIVPLGTAVCDFISQHGKAITESETFVEGAEKAWSQVGPYCTNLFSQQAMQSIVNNPLDNILPITVFTTLGFAAINFAKNSFKKIKITSEANKEITAIRKSI